MDVRFWMRWKKHWADIRNRLFGIRIKEVNLQVCLLQEFS
jgi:hypothetical protein